MKGRIARRELEKKRRAAPVVGPVANRAAVRVDDAVAHRQTEAGAFADRFRREERLKEFRLVFRPDAGSVVEHFEPDLAAGVVQADQNATLLAAFGLDRLLRV